MISKPCCLRRQGSSYNIEDNIRTHKIETRMQQFQRRLTNKSFPFSSLLIWFFVLSMLTVISCKDDDNPAGGGDPCSSSFDQAAMFVNVADNIILPAYVDFQNKVNDLSAKTTAFTAAPAESSLMDLQASFSAAYLSWQAVAQYEFGPAEEVFLRNSVNNFPLNLQELEANINSGNYDFNTPDRFDKGLPALDYLLFGIGASPSEILENYTTNTLASQHLQYLTDVMADIQTRINHTVEGWNNGYRNTFVANTGTAAGTALSLIVNNLNENYELIKREKLGVPSGVVTLGFTNPENVEAFYSGQSLGLIVAALEATQQLYLGGNGLGLDDYLDNVNAQKDNQSLNSLIKGLLISSISKVNVLSGRLSDLVDSDNATVVDAYNEVTRQLVNIKTDLPSVLCVSITYIDNPSDSD